MTVSSAAHRVAWFVFALVANACVADVPILGQPDDDPDPVARAGLVSEPANGTLFVGDPAVLAFRVSGEYSQPGIPLSVQILADPDDMTSWTTITTATTNQDGSKIRFSIDVRPVTREDESVRWPKGGVLRLRVTDPAGDALPFDPADSTQTVLAVGNPGDVPAGWTYLTEMDVGSPTETAEYYQTIAAPPTLDAFMTQFGFPGGETSAIYYNAGDLGIGREMHCRATAGNGLACYVRNFGVFGGNRDQAIAETVAGGVPLATVAMVYTPPITAANAVTFMVYGPNNALINEAQLDTKGNNKSIPQNCLNCHGGRSSYDATTNAALGARFLPFDPAAFAYAQTPGLSFSAQEDKFRQLNRLVANAAATPATAELINGLFPQANTPYNGAFVPAGWNDKDADRKVYRDVIAPYCRSCHVSFGQGATDVSAFQTAAGTRARANAIVSLLCGPGPRGMPVAEQTTTHFFQSNARAVMLQWLGEAGSCAPTPVNAAD